MGNLKGVDRDALARRVERLEISCQDTGGKKKSNKTEEGVKYGAFPFDERRVRGGPTGGWVVPPKPQKNTYRGAIREGGRTQEGKAESRD